MRIFCQFVSLNSFKHFLFQKMLKEKLICHASGDFNHPFIVGFYLYHIVHNEKDPKGKSLIVLIFLILFLVLYYSFNENNDNDNYLEFPLFMLIHLHSDEVLHQKKLMQEEQEEGENCQFDMASLEDDLHSD